MKTRRIALSIAVIAVALMVPTFTAWSIEYNLTQVSPINVPGAVPVGVNGTAIFANYWDQPTGTGVFNPFLTIHRKPIEQGFNTDGSPLYMDQQRPHWNTTLQLGSLADMVIDGVTYHGFILDANEPDSRSLISIDNVRIYTSPDNNTALVGDDLSQLNQLGTLRWALNDPTYDTAPDGSMTYHVANWVLLDADQNNVGFHSNGGSGQADMILYVPVAAFGDALDSDYVWFYNLNGVQCSADPAMAAESGYEEWRAVVETKSVPDGGMTIGLLGLALAAIGLVARKLA